MKQLILAALVILALGGEAWAVDGNDLHSWCFGKTGGYFEGQCFGYVIATSDLTRHFGEFCAPDGMLRAQAVDVVRKYLKGHPESRHKTASNLVYRAFKEAFPCPKK